VSLVESIAIRCHVGRVSTRLANKHVELAASDWHGVMTDMALMSAVLMSHQTHRTATCMYNNYLSQVSSIPVLHIHTDSYLLPKEGCGISQAMALRLLYSCLNRCLSVKSRDRRPEKEMVQNRPSIPTVNVNCMQHCRGVTSKFIDVTTYYSQITPARHDNSTVKLCRVGRCGLAIKVILGLLVIVTNK